jgi:uncharacterized membrane protein
VNDESTPAKNTTANSDLPQGHTKVSFGRRLVNYFLTGLVIAGPIAITVYIAWWIIGLVDDFVKPLIPPQYNPDTYLPVHVPGFGLMVAVVFIMLLGFFAANFVGRTLVQMGERFFSRLPMISTLYSGLKQIFETVVTQSNKSFKQVGLIQYPRPGLWAIVLISTEASGEIAHKVEGNEPVMSCFLPTTPNPTSGFLLFVPVSEVTILDMTTEEAAKLIISAGLVSPEYQKQTAKLAASSGAAAKAKAAKPRTKRTTSRKSPAKTGA